jgi:hypothetical protein
MAAAPIHANRGNAGAASWFPSGEQKIFFRLQARISQGCAKQGTRTFPEQAYAQLVISQHISSPSRQNAFGGSERREQQET